MKIKILIAVGLLMSLGTGMSAEGIHFNRLGEIIAPDKRNLDKGIEAEKLGHENDALRYFKKAARYGNSHALALIGFMHLKQKEYISALAWFKLIDLEMIPNDDMLQVMILELESKLSDSEKEVSSQLNVELQDTYSKHAALLHREMWKKRLKFGGTHFRGHVPDGLSVHVSGDVHLSALTFRTMVTNMGGQVLRAPELELQLHEFVYNYELQFMNGEVKLHDVEFVEEDKQI